MGVIVEATYPSGGALRVEIETQLSLGGIVLDGIEVPSTLDEGDRVSLKLVAGAIVVVVDAQVTERSDSSLCLELGDEAIATLTALELTERAAAEAPIVRVLGAAPAKVVDTVERRLVAMSIGEKVQMALHGDRQWRALLGRDRAGVIQAALIRNPRVTVDEMTALARGPFLAPDAAEALAQHPSFGSSPTIALALVRNPRTPIPTAVAMVHKLSPTDLRTIAKGLGIKTQVAAAARKKLL